MKQQNNSNTSNTLKRGRGRPPSSRVYNNNNEVKSKPHDFVECCLCWRIYDLNANYRSLDQAIIDDKKFCPDCWKNEIMQKEYKDQQDIIQQFFRNFKMRRW
jgi:hypothetical protein